MVQTKNRVPSLEVSFLGDSRLPPRDEITNEDQEILNHHLEQFRILQKRDLLSQNEKDNAGLLAGPAPPAGDSRSFRSMAHVLSTHPRRIDKYLADCGVGTGNQIEKFLNDAEVA